ncbi:hypothetical protein [Lysinibacillus fusiformis]|uniref:hypothetical protein n=1 Tax=Lysinibacillus fusiformis TaxID=28031 RepID=UPI0018830943|nr:hypothetical protein [Lysinibacillus fusiformis]MBD8522357.1 hypothetical protein [Lysinibacillus fusiformis]
MLKNWTNRDWVWLLGFLIFIIMLLLANYYLEWETNLSIIANATSIALAVIAIFLSLKQDSDSKIISNSMQQDIQSLHKEFLRKQFGYNKMLDEVQLVVDKNIEIEEKSDEHKSYSYDELVDYGERIKHETIESFRAELLDKLEEDLKKSLIKYNNDNKFDIDEYIIFGDGSYAERYEKNKKIDKIIRENKNKPISYIKNKLLENDCDLPVSVFQSKLNKIRKEDVE